MRYLTVLSGWMLKAVVTFSVTEHRPFCAMSATGRGVWRMVELASVTVQIMHAIQSRITPRIEIGAKTSYDKRHKQPQFHNPKHIPGLESLGTTKLFVAASPTLHAYTSSSTSSDVCNLAMYSTPKANVLKAVSGTDAYCLPDSGRVIVATAHLPMQIKSASADGMCFMCETR